MIRLLLTAFLLMGCGGEKMATTGQEYELELISTNVPNRYPTFPNDGVVEKGTLIEDIGVSGYVWEAQETFYNNPDTSLYNKTVNDSHESPKFYCNTADKLTYTGVAMRGVLPVGYPVSGGSITKYITPKNGVMFGGLLPDSEPASGNIYYNDNFLHSGKLWYDGDFHWDPSDSEVVYTENDFALTHQDMFFQLQNASSGEPRYIATIGGVITKDVDALAALSADGTLYDDENHVSGIWENRRASAPSSLTDTLNITQSEHDNEILISASPTHKINAIAVSNVTASSIYWEILDDGDVIDSGEVGVDCWLDADHLLPQGGTTVLIPLGRMISTDYVINITITNNGTVRVGNISGCITVDDGVTGYDLSISTINFNDHTPDPWGNIELGRKAVVTKLAYTVRGDAKLLSQSHRRHKSMEEKIVIVDATDIALETNCYSIQEAVKRGIMTVSSTALVIKNGVPTGAAEYKVSVQEVV